jgi:hypothetical protein
LDNPATSLNTARQVLAGGGTQTAALACGGRSNFTDATEEYDGTSWATNPTGLNTARSYLGGSRNTNSSISFWW